MCNLRICSWQYVLCFLIFLAKRSPTPASCHYMQDRSWHQLGAIHFHIFALPLHYSLEIVMGDLIRKFSFLASQDATEVMESLSQRQH